MIPARTAIEYERYEFKKWEHFDAETIVETPVSLTVNGQVWISFMCTPIHLEELAVGFLFNEGIITSLKDVADVRVCEQIDAFCWHAVHAAQVTAVGHRDAQIVYGALERIRQSGH